MSYKCYSCLETIKYKDLLYRSRCDKKKGICKKCTDIPNIKWKEQPSYGCFSKIHTTTFAYDIWWKSIVVNTKNNWLSFTTNKDENECIITYSNPGFKYTVYPNDIKNEEERKEYVKKFWKYNNLTAEEKSNTYKKYVTIPIPKTCICCD